MPPAVQTKSSRSSLYGWTKKRSVSPATAPEPPLKCKPSSSSIATFRRSDESPYNEDDYQDKVLEYMHEMDSMTLASSDLMNMQPELQWFMRPYLIDFLVEVHQQFRLRPEVLFLAMNIVDRYVSKRVVYKKHYQLVGCAALWIAAKFEDGKDKVPLVRELAEMCCKAYDESAFIQMEGHVLSTIGWVTGHPSAEAWLRHYTSGTLYEDTKVANIGRFLMEITLFHREFVGIQSHHIAVGAMMLARFICGKGRRFSNPDRHAIRVAQAIDKHFSEKLESISDIVIRKYAPTYYSRASTLVREWYLSGRSYQHVVEYPETPLSAGMPTPGLAPSGSWSTKRGSWMSGSPSTGSLSCASSDAGDEVPVTPLTPAHSQNAIDPFSTSSKENIAPGYFAAAAATMVKPIKQAMHPNSDVSMGVYQHQHQQYANPQVQQHRPVLTCIPAVSVGELSLPARTLRRLSN